MASLCLLVLCPKSSQHSALVSVPLSGFATDEGLTNASAKQRLDNLETKKEDLEVTLAKDKIEKTPFTREQIVFWLSSFRDGDIDDPAHRRNIVDIFVNSVFLYQDKLIIVFNYNTARKPYS